MNNALKTRILNHQDIIQKLKRIAYQILEDNYDEKELYLIGIEENGAVLCRHIAGFLESISDMQIQTGSIAINKKNPERQVAEIKPPDLPVTGKTVIMVDDVAHTGRTLIYSLIPVMAMHPAKLRIAVLVDRQHKRYAVQPDFVGLSLATTMKEHIHVHLGDEYAVYLQ